MSKFICLYRAYLLPSIQPGNGSFKVLSTMLGLSIITGSFPFVSSTTISPIALVNAYVFGHPYFCALLHQGESESKTGFMHFQVSIYNYVNK